MQLWTWVRPVFKRFFSLLLLGQVISPFVAWLAVLAGGTGEQQQVETYTVLPQAAEIVDFNEVRACPDGDMKLPSRCPSGLPCSDLGLECLECSCPYNCTYGSKAAAHCRALPEVACTGPPQFERQFTCSYCYLTDPSRHKCSNKHSCRSTGPTKYQWYVANCTSHRDTICLGRYHFNKRRKCDWTEGYSWNTALALSITLGGFGADRFYLGHWQEGIGKLFSFGGLGVWTLVDVVLVAVGYIGPADGSLYV